MTPEQIEPFFTRSDGAYLCARWGRPIAPVVFGVDDATLSIVKGAMEAVVTVVGHQMAEQDPELGVNMMVFFFRDWAELTELPDLDHRIPDLDPLVKRLEGEGANQYRLFRFDDAGAIQAVFVFLRMDQAMAAVPAEDLALSQAVQSICLWADGVWAAQSPLAKAGDTVILRPDIAGLIRAVYDPVLPAVANDSSHAMRLSAWMAVAG